MHDGECTAHPHRQLHALFRQLQGDGIAEQRDGEERGVGRGGGAGGQKASVHEVFPQRERDGGRLLRGETAVGVRHRQHRQRPGAT